MGNKHKPLDKPPVKKDLAPVPPSAPPDYRRFFELSLNLFCVAGFDGYIKKVNPAWEKILGFSEEELKSKPYIEFVHPDDRPATLAEAKKIERDAGALRFENRYLCRDGSYKRFLWNAAPVPAERLIYAVAEDVTAQRDLKQKALDRAGELAEADMALESFAYSVSQGLRTPLRAIDGFSRIVLEDYGDKLDEEGRRLLGVARSNALRMAKLIDDLLAFSRLSRQEMTPENIDMSDLARCLFQELKGALSAKPPEFELKGVPPAYGDPAMMRQALGNLLSNAVKFSSKKKDARIEMGGRCGEKENVYYVKDNGVGFDMQYAGRLFGIFQRLHAENEFEGTGVGLAIVQRVIRRHGGRVWAESRLDGGAAFYFALPRKGG